MKEKAQQIYTSVAANAGTLDCLMTYAIAVNSIDPLIDQLDKESDDPNVLSDYSECFNTICEKINEILSNMEKLQYDSKSTKPALDVLYQMKKSVLKLPVIKTNLINRINKLQGKIDTNEQPKEEKAKSEEKSLEDLINSLEGKTSDVIPPPQDLPTLDSNLKLKELNNSAKAA